MHQYNVIKNFHFFPHNFIRWLNKSLKEAYNLYTGKRMNTQSHHRVQE